MFYLHICMHHGCFWYLWRPEKGVGSLELEVEMVVSHLYGICWESNLSRWYF